MTPRKTPSISLTQLQEPSNRFRPAGTHSLEHSERTGRKEKEKRGEWLLHYKSSSTIHSCTNTVTLI